MRSYLLRKKQGQTKAAIEYELLSNNPYTFTQEELLFEVHARHKLVSEKVHSEARITFFQKPQPCFRSSMLPKKYGWGIHFNNEGKGALVPMESQEYQDFITGKNKGTKLLKAMRNKRESK
ncbi:DUF6157 family protein [Planococcus sp. N028]|uniref:DUF6157 family protein n=1 Tax=Planococcus shixiaomingii TaxID=3058393 RepID=A0ABT8N3J6_9BACL|nr:DUF6157 family protein [Planococcus sp. N028]MDN7242459.1 DUF6157 family protein [Planococcus sp. N028]